jgi:hypothetical protein
MDALFFSILALCASHLPVCSGALQADAQQRSTSADAVRRLSAEFDLAERSAFDVAGQAKTEAERNAASHAMPDRRKFAQRFLEMARETNDASVTVDALVWVVQRGARIPEGDEAVRMIADHHLKSDRIAALCHALGARGLAGEALLKRIFDENPNPGIRGRVCLALAFARSLELREVTRPPAILPRNRPAPVEIDDVLLEKRRSASIALAEEVEQKLRQVLDEFPGVLFERDITDNFGYLTENLGTAAEQILRRIAETHPHLDIRWEAECGLALQEMKIASLVAELRSVASLPPGSKQCAVPELAASSVFGGKTRLSAVDSKALVREIEERLQRIADRVNEVKEPGPCYFHLIVDSPALSQYHAGTEKLLRSAAERHPNRRFRAGARRSLAIYLAGIAALSGRIDSDRAFWIDALGEDRVEQIRRRDRVRLIQESSALADELSKENQSAGKIPDAQIEKLRQANSRR